MKKIILIAAAAIISVTSIGYAASSLQKVADHSKCEGNFKCPTCNGTGWQGRVKCMMCKGTGSY